MNGLNMTRILRYKSIHIIQSNQIINDLM